VSHKEFRIGDYAIVNPVQGVTLVSAGPSNYKKNTGRVFKIDGIIDIAAGVQFDIYLSAYQGRVFKVGPARMLYSKGEGFVHGSISMGDIVCDYIEADRCSPVTVTIG